MASDPLDVAVQVARVLDALGVPYALGGALASAVLGEPRATEDIAFVAGLGPEHAEALIAALRERFYVPEGLLREAISRRSSFNVIHLESMRRVDVFVARETGLDQDELRRRLHVTIAPGQQLVIATPEDVILQKLDWYRRGAGVSDRQWRDVLGVIKVQGDRLDRTYLDRWAATLGLVELIERAFQESGQ